jgi:hypothetical protein
MNFATPNWIFLSIFFLYPFFSNGQCSEMGARSGTVFSNDNSTGSFAFSSPANISSSDNNRASATALLTLLSGNTNYLKASGFGFTLPAGAAICGIKAELEKSATGINILASVRDHSVQLLKAGNIVGSNHALPDNWTSTETYSTYGGVMDDWATGWNAADINDPGFGIVLSASITGLVSLLPSARVDHMRITVYYNLVLPTEILSFTVKQTGDHSAILQWSLASNNGGAGLFLQRKLAVGDWTTIHSQTLDDNSFAETKYSFSDSNCPEEEATYRIKKVETTGKIEYSKSVTIKWDAYSLQAYPNPASDHFYIRSKSDIHLVTAINAGGIHYKLPLQKIGTALYRVSIQCLSTGQWWLKINGKWIMVQKQ